MYDRAVQLTGAHKHNIERFQIIALSLDGVADIPLQKDQDLIEIMIMKGEILLCVILQMKYFKIAFQIAGF